MLILSAWVTPLWAQSDSTAVATEELDEALRFEVAGTYRFGVYDTERDSLVVDTVFDEVVIVEDQLFECSYNSRRTSDGQMWLLPGSVTEFYNTEGVLMSRNFMSLLERDKPRYETVLAFAKAAGLKDLESLAKYNMGVDYEVQGMRREAYQYYMRAYKACPQHTFAKERADAVQKAVETERKAISDKLDAERLEQQRIFEQRQAVWAAQCNYWNNYGKQVAATSRKATTQQKTVHSTAKGKSASTTGRASSTKSNTQEKGKTKTRTMSHSAPKLSGQDKDQPCSCCQGRRSCPWCSGGKVNGFMCNYCKGSNICSRCRGTGKRY